MRFLSRALSTCYAAVKERSAAKRFVSVAASRRCTSNAVAQGPNQQRSSLSRPLGKIKDQLTASMRLLSHALSARLRTINSLDASSLSHALSANFTLFQGIQQQRRAFSHTSPLDNFYSGATGIINADGCSLSRAPSLPSRQVFPRWRVLSR